MTLFAPQSVSADISQFHSHPLSSPHSFMPTSSYRLDPNDTFRSIVTSRTTTALIAGKKITQEAAVVVNLQDRPLPRAVSVESRRAPPAKPEPPPAANPKPKSDTRSAKNTRRPKEEKRETRQESPKKPLVPRLPHKQKQKPSPLASPVAAVPVTVPKTTTPQQSQRIRSLLQASVRSTLEEIERKQALERAKSEEQLKRRVALEQRAKEIREMNSRAQKQMFSPKYAWGVNPEKGLQKVTELRQQVQLDKEKCAEVRAKSAEQTAEMRRINRLIREHSRPLAPRTPDDQQSSNPPTSRSQKREEIAGFMRKQQLKRREQSQNEELERMASEARRVTRLKMLEAKEKRKLEVHKKRKGKTEVPTKPHRKKKRSKQSSRISEGKDVYLESSSTTSALASQKDLLQTLLRRKERSSVASSHDSEQPPQAAESTDYQRLIEENKQKIEDYKRRIEGMRLELHSKEDSKETEEEAAVRIQAWARMIIARNRYRAHKDQPSDSFLSGLNVMSPNPKHSLSFDHPSPPEAGQHLSPRELQERIQREELNFHRTLEETEKVSLQREQLGLEPVEEQLALLQASRQEDKEQFSVLVKEICGEQQEGLAEEIRKAYEALIERRYDQLNQLFAQQRQATEGILKDIPQAVDLSKQSDHTSFDGPKQTDPSPRDSSLDERLEDAIGSAASKAIEQATEAELAKIRETAAMRAESPQARPENPLSFMEMDTPSPREVPAGDSPQWSDPRPQEIERYETVAYNPDELRILEQLKDADLSPSHTPEPTFYRQLPDPLPDALVSEPRRKPSDQTIDYVTDRILETLFKEIEELQVTEARAMEFDAIPRISVSSEALIREQESFRNECGVKVDDEAICEFVALVLETEKASIVANLAKPLSRSPLTVLSRLQAVDLGLIPKNPLPCEVVPSSAFSTLQEHRDYTCVQKAPLSQQQLLLDSHQIHDKMIFDAVNEALGGWRNYGEKGVPMPWSAAYRRMTQVVTPQEAAALVMRQLSIWNSARLGLMPHLDSPLSTQSEEIVQLQREEKLVQDIIIDTITNDEQWCDYEDEETQVKLDLADMVLESLMSEVLSILSRHS